MPELPEVEVVRIGLQNVAQERPEIVDIIFHRKDLRYPIPTLKLKKLVGSKLLAVDRRAKYLIIKTSRGGILSHLGMTGVWKIAPFDEKRQKHDHVEIVFSNEKKIIYNDPRRFGLLETIDLKEPNKNPRLKGLGIEPFAEEFNGDFLKSNFRRKKTSVKAAIMDQSLAVGVGNIYASEVLFAIGVLPTRKASKLSLQECNRLSEQVKIILKDSIEKGGSTISNFFNSSGERGSYQERHLVYNRKNEGCLASCGSKIKSKIIAGRSTFWCPSCQK